MLRTNNIYHGDCLELMWDIDDHSIDMILADLPYGTTACAWDSIIPLEPLWAHYKRIIKPRGAIVLTASQPFTSMLVTSNLDWFKYEWVWDKVTSSGLLAKVRPVIVTENILVFCKTSPNYFPIKTLRKNKIRQKVRKSSESAPLAYNDEKYRNYEDMNPKNLIRFHNRNGGGKYHPTQKPVALFAYLIRTYTNPGDLVLDNTAGSGTTAIAAIETGRNWICMEKDESYCQIAKERIAERLKQPFLPGILEDTTSKQSEQLELI